MTSTEIWRPAPGVPTCYEVSDQGRVRSWKRTDGPHILRPGLNPKDYPFVALQFPDGQHSITVHRLVARAFLGARPPGMVTRHLNGDQTDNRVENLRYGTRSENELDKIAHGTHPQASRTHCADGHPFDETNTRHYRGRRYCRTCQAKWNAQRATTRAGRRGDVGDAA